MLRTHQLILNLYDKEQYPTHFFNFEEDDNLDNIFKNLWKLTNSMELSLTSPLSKSSKIQYLIKIRSSAARLTRLINKHFLNKGEIFFKDIDLDLYLNSVHSLLMLSKQLEHKADKQILKKFKSELSDFQESLNGKNFISDFNPRTNRLLVHA